MKNKNLPVYVAISVSVAAMLMLTIMAFTGGLLLAPHYNGNAQAAILQAPVESAQPAPPLAADDDIIAAFEQAFIDIYDNALPSVVSINVTKKVDFGAFNFDRPDGNGEPDTPSEPDSKANPDSDKDKNNQDGGQEDNPNEFFDRGGGSRFVWDKEGYIVTNNHVVDQATDIEVIFADDTRVPAEVVGTDPDADLAVIKVDLPASYLKPVRLGNSDALRVGQLSIAIGNPFGQDFTMTSGIISSVGRTIRSGNSLFSIPEVIQTDAPINPGNSGGPLFNRQGQVIGINTQIISQSGSNSGIGLAVPINISKGVGPTLIEGDDFEYAWLGISGRTLDSETAELMNIPANTNGALVIDVAKDGPADKAGFQGIEEISAGAGDEISGDIIVAFNGEPVHGMDDLITYLVSDAQPGDTVDFELIRADGKRETVSVVLGKRPDVQP